MMHWIEEHPYLTGGLILGLIVLFIIWRNRSAAAAGDSQGGTPVYTGGPSDALQAAQLQAGAGIEASHIQAQVQLAAYDDAVRAQQIESQAQTTGQYIAAGVSNLQTAAALQYGLAGLGYSPTISPFGVTIPITNDYLYPGAPRFPGSPDTQIIVNVGPGITTPPTSPTGSPVVTSSSPYQSTPGSIMTQSEFLGITQASTGAGSGGPVTVPSVPVYGPVYGNALPANLGYSAPSTIPTSSNLNWTQYYNQSVEPKYNTSNPQPYDVTSITAANVAAQLDYLSNPLSCHNRVCS